MSATSFSAVPSLSKDGQREPSFDRLGTAASSIKKAGK